MVANCESSLKAENSFMFFTIYVNFDHDVMMVTIGTPVSCLQELVPFLVMLGYREG